LYGKLTLMPSKVIGAGGDVLALRGGDAGHAYIEFYRDHGVRTAFIGIPSKTSQELKISSHGLTDGIGLEGTTRVTNGRLINKSAYDTTTSTAANMYVTSNGYFARSTSAKKYKTEIQPANVDYTKILNIIPKSWYDIAEVKKNGWSTEGLRRYYGAIADEFEAVGLPEYVVYENGVIENFNDRAWILLIPNINDLKAEVNELKGKVSSLESGMAELRAEIQALKTKDSAE